MSDFTAVPLAARGVPAQLTSTWLEDVSSLAKGLLFTVALGFAGMFLVIVAMMVGVVGAPILAAAIPYVLLRRGRAVPERASVPRS